MLPFLLIDRVDGEAYGRAAAEKIASSAAIYRFLLRAAIEPPALEHALATKLSIVERSLPDLARELEAVAAGASVPVGDVVLVNTRSELLSMGWNECTSIGIAASRSASGAHLVGQTWDWFPPLRESPVVVRARPAAGPSFITFCESGQLAKIGFNEAGLAVGLNFLDPPPDERVRAREGIPVHILARAALGTRSVKEALELLDRLPRGGCVNLVLADRERVVTAEVRPSRIDVIEAEAGIVTHANTFEARLQPMTQRPCRSARARSLLDGVARISREDLAGVFRDHHRAHSEQICCHPLEDYEWAGATLAALVLEPGARTLWASAGPPCEHELARYELT